MKLHKVLVTGGAGFLGTHISENLLNEGHDVVVVDILNSDTTSTVEKEQNVKHLRCVAESKLNASFSFYKYDILEQELIESVLIDEAPDICIHAASLVMDRRSVDVPMDYVVTNINGSQVLLNAIRKTNTIKKFVFVSTRSAVGETPSPLTIIKESDPLRPINPYGSTKVAVESLLHSYHENFGLSISICRMQPIYGPRGRKDMMPRIIIESLLNQSPIIKYGTGEATRDWTYVTDAAAGVIATIDCTSGFKIYNVGTSTGTTLNELIDLAEEVLNQKLNIINKSVPTGDAVYAGICDNTELLNLGWKPKVSLEKGLKMTYDFMKAQYEKKLSDVKQA